MQAEISIHALREEGDHRGRADAALLRSISIHALREEGDPLLAKLYPVRWNFYPRPPRGGRLSRFHLTDIFSSFLSTPSARRATRTSLVGGISF